MELQILYEDADIVAVAKPSGLLTHIQLMAKKETAPTSEVGVPTESVGAEDWFKEKSSESGGGYVHRLDRDTSGVLVFAKNPTAYEFLRKAFHDRDIKKTYLAIVHGMPKEKKGMIDFDIGRSRKDFRLRSAQPKAKGRLRDALTRYEVIGEVEGYSLMRLNPETGRTHQIRVHLKAIHHPIVGDTLYAPNHKPAFGITRLALHASTLDIPLPSGGRTLITAPIPDDLVQALAHFPRAW
jgi:23S rRNA pseudouridine1911/1915/1917 synthase